MALCRTGRSSGDSSNGLHREMEYLQSCMYLHSSNSRSNSSSNSGTIVNSTRPGGAFCCNTNLSAPLLPLLETLGITGFMKLLSAVLTEKRILVVSDSLEKLCRSVCAVRSMLCLSACPATSGTTTTAGVLDWHHVFIPALPVRTCVSFSFSFSFSFSLFVSALTSSPPLQSSLLMMLDAPMPYLVGVKRYLLDKIDDGDDKYVHLSLSLSPSLSLSLFLSLSLSASIFLPLPRLHTHSLTHSLNSYRRYDDSDDEYEVDATDGHTKRIKKTNSNSNSNSNTSSYGTNLTGAVYVDVDSGTVEVVGAAAGTRTRSFGFGTNSGDSGKGGKNGGGAGEDILIDIIGDSQGVGTLASENLAKFQNFLGSDSSGGTTGSGSETGPVRDRKSVVVGKECRV